MLDGDIDPMWIESLNTVMDDNKVLTLASNERIPLNSTMRLLFEISHLRTATPATVSRAGILYINPQDLGWGRLHTGLIRPFHASFRSSSSDMGGITTHSKRTRQSADSLRQISADVHGNVEIESFQEDNTPCRWLPCVDAVSSARVFTRSGELSTGMSERTLRAILRLGLHLGHGLIPVSGPGEQRDSVH